MYILQTREKGWPLHRPTPRVWVCHTAHGVIGLLLLTSHASCRTLTQGTGDVQGQLFHLTKAAVPSWDARRSSIYSVPSLCRASCTETAVIARRGGSPPLVLNEVPPSLKRAGDTQRLPSACGPPARRQWDRIGWPLRRAPP